MGQSTSSANVGLSIATGATSRRIGFACGGILIVLAFVPKLAVLFAIMPSPVIGALLFFAASFMIVAGVQILTSRMMDARKTFVVGVVSCLGVKRGYVARRLPKRSCHAPARFYLLAFGGHVVGTALEPLVSHRHRAACEAANRPTRGFFRANICIYGEAGRSLGCAQGSDRPRQVCDERIHRSRKPAGAEHRQDRR